MGRKKKDEYDQIYEDDFALGLRYNNGRFEGKTEFIQSPDVLAADSGNTNYTPDSPDDILKIAVYCCQCGAFMKYVRGDSWMGDYVCSTCKASVSEADATNKLSRPFDDYNDIYGDN